MPSNSRKALQLFVRVLALTHSQKHTPIQVLCLQEYPSIWLKYMDVK